MSKISKAAKSMVAEVKFEEKKPEVNFMGGISYKLNPIDTLKMITASSIFAEPQYYRGSSEKPNYIDPCVAPYALFPSYEQTSTEVMIDTINKALDYDFGATIDWAAELRSKYFMRLNPQMIMVMASVHYERFTFDTKNPGVFREINDRVMQRADEPATQLSCYLYLNKGSKKHLPTILKRSWKDKLESLKPYQISKYKNAEAGMINTIRLCHASSPVINELMKTGTVVVKEDEETWERLHSAGKSFKEILQQIELGHMALLRNLRNIFSELKDGDRELAEKVLTHLKDGVLTGKQFPFRYYSAYNVIENTNINFKGKVLDTLEECIDISIANMPKLRGKTACLSDNSGSAWGTLNSEYGSATIAVIDNLSSVILGACSDEAEVFKFGDRIKKFDVRKRQGVLSQAKAISGNGRDDVGGGTENGIWMFFENAIKNKIHYDNIFIFSDQQAGHGGLYGTDSVYAIDGEDYGIGSRVGYERYIDVMRLADKYRKTVNPKFNFFTVQTAGYTNALIPEYTYRGSVLYGWTGKEAVFANEIIKQWDEIEARQ